MSGLLPGHILVHSAVPVSYEEPAESPVEWVEGEPGEVGGGEPTPGAAFRCVLFMPGPGGSQNTSSRMRTVREPTLLYNPTRDDGSDVTIGGELELDVTAPELAPVTGGETVRWLVVGDPQPFGRPGTVGGYQATLRQVKD